jgi:hypothetical protein
MKLLDYLPPTKAKANQYVPPTKAKANHNARFSKSALISYVIWFLFIFVPLTYNVATASGPEDIGAGLLALWLLFAVLPMTTLLGLGPLSDYFGD